MDENFDFERYFKEAQKKLGRANIIITGKTGVGKSTLINSVFGQDLAKVGVGTPVTKNIQEYTKDGIPISLFDTRGLELGNYQEIAKELKDEIGKRRGADPDKHSHGRDSAVALEHVRRHSGLFGIQERLSVHGTYILLLVNGPEIRRGIRQCVDTVGIGRLRI